MSQKKIIFSFNNYGPIYFSFPPTDPPTSQVFCFCFCFHLIYSPPPIPYLQDIYFSFTLFISTQLIIFISPLSFFNLFHFLCFIFFIFLYFIHCKLSLSLSLSSVLQNINYARICVLNLLLCCVATTLPLCRSF